MMTLGDIISFVNYILLKESNGSPYTIPNFNTVLPLVAQETFNDIVANYEINKKNSNQIAPFKVSYGNGTSPLVIDSDGKAPKPTDYYRTSSLTYKYVVNKEVKYSTVTELTDDQFESRKGSSLLKPSYKKPIMTIKDTYFEFMPKNLQYVDFTFIRNFLKPHFGYYIDQYAQEVFMPEGTSHILLTGEVGENDEKPITSGLTAQGLPSPAVEGQWHIYTDTNVFNYYDGAAWSIPSIYTTLTSTTVISTTVELTFTQDTIPLIILKLLEKASFRLQLPDLERYSLMKEAEEKQSNK